MKKIFLILISLVIAALLSAAAIPTHFKIEQEIIINKPRVVVFDYTKMTKTNGDWNPFIKKDPKIVQNFKGEEGTVGFINAWGNDKAFNEQEIINLIPNERIDFELRFIKPVKPFKKAYITTNAFDEGHTRVALVVEENASFPYNLICFFKQKDLKKDLSLGLKNLKEALEQ